MDKREFKASLRQDFFRMLIYGASGSGKSFFLTKKLLPMIKDQYNAIFIFTLPENNGYYKKAVEREMNKKLYLVNQGFLPVLKKITEQQRGNTSGKDELGNPKFRSNLLFIWDDVLSEKVLRNQEFVDQFTHMRHLHISTILITQITNKAISPQLRSNVTHSVIFKINDYMQRRDVHKLLENVVACDWDREGHEYQPRDLQQEAAHIFTEHVLRKPFGFVVITQECELYVPEEVLIRTN